MAEDPVNKMTSQLSPDNRAWVEHLPKDQQRKLLQKWQNEGGNTGLASVGTDQNYVDADALVEEWRKG